MHLQARIQPKGRIFKPGFRGATSPAAPLRLFSEFRKLRLTDENPRTISFAILSHQKGVAIVTFAGRAAVDAEGAWTTALKAYGKGVWSWLPDAGVKFAAQGSADDGGNKARFTEESAL
jgi:hypothetical protein